MVCATLTAEMGACDRPALMPVTPQVSTPPRPLVLKLEPNTASSLCFRVAVTSSRHKLEHAAQGPETRKVGHFLISLCHSSNS